MLDLLPVEVLSQVTDLLEGRHIALLWMAGDKTLNERLGSGGGVSSFHLVIDSLYVNAWPSIVRHFPRLRSFSVSQSGSDPTLKWCPDYSQLSPTIRSIKTSMQMDLTSILEVLKRDSGAFRLLETLHFPYCTREAGETLFLTRLGDLPNLSSIFCSEPLRVTPVDLKALPLTHLKLFLRARGSRDDFSFPSTLETLEVNWMDQSSIPSDYFLGLPSGLIKFTFFRDRSTAPISPAHLLNIPRQLKHLFLDLGRKLSIADIEALPPNLLSFGAYNFKIDQEVAEEWVSKLPRTLLSCSVLPQPKKTTLPLFPPNLTHIDNVPCYPVMYEYLPRNLTSISFGAQMNASSPKTKWPKLPDSLTSIHRLDSRYLEDHNLPSGLKVLKMFGEWLTPSAVQALPRNLQELTVTAAGGPFETFFELIPRFLVRLEMTHIDLAMSDSDCRNLPRTLIWLSLSTVRFTTEDAPNQLSQFPTELEKLDLKAERLDAACLRAFPAPKLRELALTVRTHVAGVAHQILTTLPRRLRKFDYVDRGCKALDVTNNSFELLPRGITDVSVAPEATGLSTPTWPPTLFRFKLGKVDYSG